MTSKGRKLFEEFERFKRIGDAKTPSDAIMYAAFIQEGTARDLIQSVNKLRTSVKTLSQSSSRLETATNTLVVLTLFVAVLTLFLLLVS